MLSTRTLALLALLASSALALPIGPNPEAISARDVASANDLDERGLFSLFTHGIEDLTKIGKTGGKVINTVSKVNNTIHARDLADDIEEKLDERGLFSLFTHGIEDLTKIGKKGGKVLNTVSKVNNTIGSRDLTDAVDDELDECGLFSLFTHGIEDLTKVGKTGGKVINTVNKVNSTVNARDLAHDVDDELDERGLFGLIAHGIGDIAKIGRKGGKIANTAGKVSGNHTMKRDLDELAELYSRQLLEDFEDELIERSMWDDELESYMYARAEESFAELD